MASRLLADLSTKLDASGNGTLVLDQPMLEWAKGTLAIRAAAGSAPTYDVAIGVGRNAVHTVDLGLGSTLRSGPYILSPGESIVVTITGGTPNDQIKGTLFGLQGLDPNYIDTDAPASNSISISAGTVNVSGIVSVSISGTPNVNIANTPAVTVASGTINIGNTPSVTISGTPSVTVTSGTVSIGNTPAVTISGTPSVTVSSGTVNIGNTPSVTISGTPTVILGAGIANVGTIQAISSTVTVAGTINVGNTPAVTISGTPTVNIGNTPSVTITGTTTVNLGAGVPDVVGTLVALNALNAAALVVTSGLNGAGMVLATGTLIGTIVPELSLDGGTTWIATQFFNPTDSSLASSIVFAVANTATVRSILTVAGTSHIRVRVSAYTSGTANCTLRATASQIINVNISGQPTVILGGGTASIGSVSAIGSTVTVAGTINVGNTPSVSITGTPSVTISSGSVSITGTPNINITSQSVSVNVNSPPSTITSQTTALNSTTTYGPYTLPAGTHAVGLMFRTQVSGFAVLGGTTGTSYGLYGLLASLPAGQGPTAGYYVVPVNQAFDPTINIKVSTNTTQACTWNASAVLDTQGVQLDASLYDLNSGTPLIMVGGLETVNNNAHVLSMQSVYGSVTRWAAEVLPTQSSITTSNTINITAAVSTPTTIFASNTSRKAVSFWNNATGNAFIYANVTVTANIYTNAFMVVGATPAAGNFGSAVAELPRNPHIYTQILKTQALAGAMNLMATEWT